jgi:hypothetical protein
MLWGVGLFEFALAVSVIRVSSAIPTFLSPTLVVVLGPFGVRTTFVGHAGPLCLRGPSIRFAFVFVLPFVRMTFTRDRGFFAIILGLLFFLLSWRAEIELVIPS